MCQFWERSIYSDIGWDQPTLMSPEPKHCLTGLALTLETLMSPDPRLLTALVRTSHELPSANVMWEPLMLIEPGLSDLRPSS